MRYNIRVYENKIEFLSIKYLEQKQAITIERLLDHFNIDYETTKVLFDPYKERKVEK